MILLTQLTNSASQKFVLTSETGEAVEFALRFLPRINSWVFDCSSGEFNVKGARLANSPNLLRQWRNNIDFGLMVTSTDGGEPQFLNDLATGRVSIYLLNVADIADIEQNIYL